MNIRAFETTDTVIALREACGLTHSWNGPRDVRICADNTGAREFYRKPAYDTGGVVTMDKRLAAGGRPPG